MSTGTGRPDPDDYDARFADIVARWDDPPDEALDTGRRPVAGATATPDGPEHPPHDDQPIPVDDDTDPDGADSSAPPPTAVNPPVGGGGGVPWRVHEPPEDEDDESFEPAPPRPWPSFFEDWPFYLAMLGLVAGPLWLVYLAVFASTEHSRMLMAGLLTAAGFVTIVLRQPGDRNDEDDDDGARV